MYKFIKRLFDILTALAMLIFVAPLLLIISIIIKLDSPGPVFFKSIRIGQNSRPFAVLKFRTMYIKEDYILHQQYVKKLITGEFGPEKGAAEFKLKNDPRITRVGLILRRSSLDELPQLFNVLKGDMSLVGPRAAIPFEIEHYQEWQREVLKVKPGLTGLWHVYGREAGVNFDQMIKMDVDYLNDQSFFLDIKILLKTFQVAFRGLRA